MTQPERKQRLATRARLAVDAALVIAFFVFIYTVVSPHVPSSNPRMIRLWGAFTSLCLSGVFWLALQMFRVTWRAQREAEKKQVVDSQ